MKKTDNKLYTRWGKTLDVNNVLPEYPRPQMVRDSYLNLNGLWSYAILPTAQPFDGYQGQIVVPFSPECLLSGVERTVMPEDTLYYCRRFTLPQEFNRGRVLLHFGAVDYACCVRLNGRELGVHKGGYYPFEFDITDALVEGENELALAVTDPSEKGNQARGKQIMGGSGIWYAPISGIWQTVWLESVPARYIASVRLTPDIDGNRLQVSVDCVGEPQQVSWRVCDGTETVTSGVADGADFAVELSNYQLWTPENPKLYDLYLTVGEDSVRCYFGMRKFSLGKDALGVSRLMLNNRPYFQTGLLDQGYWSDGMYTAPDDEALIFDIQTMKDMGFNMLRKHIKVEPLRWYYHCDRLGMLVWQDMVSGGSGTYNPLTIGLNPFFGLLFNNKRIGHMDDTKAHYKRFNRNDEAGRDEYYRDLKRTVELLYNSVSLCLWVPHNEGWGQFDALEVTSVLRSLDPTRLVDHASGWHDQGGGDINSFHIYFTPIRFCKYNSRDQRAVALTEFGGYIYQEAGHIHNESTVFGVNMPGYRSFTSKEKMLAALRKLYLQVLLPKVQKEGLSALVYTQVSDVQDEVNGMLTYDREVVKVPVDFFREINKQFKL